MPTRVALRAARQAAALLLLLLAACFLCRAAGEQNIIITTYGPYEVHELIALSYARLAHPRARIFVAVHNYTDDSFFGHPPDKWRRHRSQEALLAGLGVTQLFVQPDETPRHAQLMRAYRHGSDSPVVYERFCLARFVTIATVIERYGLASALFVDADVVLFSNVFDLFGSHRSWGFGSWTSFWLKEDASAFADFVATFYTGDVAHDAAQLVKYGRPIYAAKDLLYWKRLESDQRSWWPLEPEGPRYYITDMEVYRVFLTTHGMAGTLRMRLPHAASTYACGVAARVDGGTAMSCPFLSSVLDSPAAPGGCYSGNVTVQQFVARFAWSARGAIRWAPTLDGLDIFSLHFNRACKFLLCQPVMCQSLTVLSPEIQRCCVVHAVDLEFLPNGAFVQDKPRLRRVAHRFSARDSAADLPARDAASAAVATPFARAEDAGGWEEG